MTKTVETVTGLPSRKDIVNSGWKSREASESPPLVLTGLPSRTDINSGWKSREASESPPLVLKYLESLPPEKEVTLVVEVVQGPPKVEFKAPKLIAQLPVKITRPTVINHVPSWRNTVLNAVNSVASIVKNEIKEEPIDDFLHEDEGVEEEDECFRIIEETVVDISTLPGKNKNFPRELESLTALISLKLAK